MALALALALALSPRPGPWALALVPGLAVKMYYQSDEYDISVFVLTGSISTFLGQCIFAAMLLASSCRGLCDQNPRCSLYERDIFTLVLLLAPYLLC